MSITKTFNEETGEALTKILDAVSIATRTGAYAFVGFFGAAYVADQIIDPSASGPIAAKCAVLFTAAAAGWMGYAQQRAHLRKCDEKEAQDPAQTKALNETAGAGLTTVLDAFSIITRSGAYAFAGFLGAAYVADQFIDPSASVPIAAKCAVLFTAAATGWMGYAQQRAHLRRCDEKERAEESLTFAQSHKGLNPPAA